MKKLTKREALTALFFGISGTLMAQQKAKMTLDDSAVKMEPMWLNCGEDGVKGVRLTNKKGKTIEITFQQIFDALDTSPASGNTERQG